MSFFKTAQPWKTTQLIGVMFFLRIWSNLGKLVQLILRVISDARDFTFFFAAWIYVFCLMNKILGSKYDDGDYPEVDDGFVMIL